ncbi:MULTISPECIES: hypothetical protein [unclassified Colwellia]|uniref:hypothetical protein n=1 Tax=unclassified Colwellia TaxID=196834 RepID=UPI0015F6D85B|nr:MULTISPECIES: hypothetical protein [unclassified Colwellia]MBA6257272.1 hypothetical protein [Colwellia sp. MB3u-28]MBA6258857.1 hypothetical protein [Colwellia sp. MB3u-41]
MNTYFETVIELSSFSYYFYISLSLLALLFYKKMKAIYDSKILKITKIKYNFVIGVVLIYVCMNLIKTYQVSQLKNEIANKNIELVEGMIEGYISEKIASREESFIINNVKFEYNDVATPKYFFANRKRSEGVISNGRFVKVSYFVDGKTKNIVKVEAKQ